MFDLARELYARDALVAIYTGYPRFKLKGEDLPQGLIHTYPWVHAPYMAFRRRQVLGRYLVQAWERWDQRLLDVHVARHIPDCDVFVGLSGSGLKTGRTAHHRGAKYVCDRGSTHIRVQAEYLHDEHERWGFEQGVLPASEVDCQTIECEEAEYEEADCITVPSSFTLRTFLDRGVPAYKLKKLPYGVNLDRFYPDGQPEEGQFDILFAGAMCLRKGVPYLLQAYKKLRHPRKTLTFAGDSSTAFIERMQQLGLWPENAIVLGHVPQRKLRQLMSKSHVLVLPSIEEGLALVQAQAMACGCPVIATSHTGAEDLFDNEREGFMVPIRNGDAIAESLQRIADDADLRWRVADAALQRVKQMGGWSVYGDQAVSIYSGLIS